MVLTAGGKPGGKGPGKGIVIGGKNVPLMTVAAGFAKKKFCVHFPFLPFMLMTKPLRKSAM